jgi:hypothetical protein
MHEGTLEIGDALLYQAWLDLRHETLLPSLQHVTQKDLMMVLHHCIARFFVPAFNGVFRALGAKGDIFQWSDPFESIESELTQESGGQSVASDAPIQSAQESREAQQLRASLGGVTAPKPTRVILNRRRQEDA